MTSGGTLLLTQRTMAIRITIIVMRNNTYINELGAKLGGYGQRPAANYVYDENVGKTIKDILKDKEALIYYVVNNP